MKNIPAYWWLILQFAATLAIIAYIPHSLVQTALLLFVWLFTFWPLTRRELIIFFLTCAIFTLADVLVVTKGVFQFKQQDIWGLPYYEPLVWGFYFLHGMRMLRTGVPNNYFGGLIFSTLTILTLFFIPNEAIMLTIAGLILIISLILFKTRADLLYVGYFIILGLLIEFFGTKTGQWSYNIDYYVWWWIITWGGAGLILYRLILPLINFYIPTR